MNGYDIAQNMETQEDGVPLSSENPTGRSFKVTSSTKFDKGYKKQQAAPAPSTGTQPQETQTVEQQPQQQAPNPYQPSNQSFSNSPYFQSSNRLTAVPSYNDYVNSRRQQQLAAQPQQNSYAQQQQVPNQGGYEVELDQDQQTLLEIKESEVEWALKKAIIPEIDKKYDDMFQQQVKKIKGVEYDKITGNAETKDMQARKEYNALVEEFAQRKQQEIDAKTQEAEQRLNMIEQRVAKGQPVNGESQPQRQPQANGNGTKTVTFSNGKTVTFHSKPERQQITRSEAGMRQSPSMGWGKPAQHQPAFRFGYGTNTAKKKTAPYSFAFAPKSNSSKTLKLSERPTHNSRPFTFSLTPTKKVQKTGMNFKMRNGGNKKW